VNISIVETAPLHLVVIRTERSGSEVRRAWRLVQELMKGHPAVSNEEYGIVVIPEWQWPTEVTTLWTGIEVASFENLPEGLEIITIPGRRFAKTTVKGNREHMEQAYGSLNEWFKAEGYERDYHEGSYGYEANRIQPVNPFDIPADTIDVFDYDIYAPIKEVTKVDPERFPAIVKIEVRADKARMIAGLEAFVQQTVTSPQPIIGQLWQDFMQRIEDISDRTDNPRSYGLLSYAPPFGPGQDFTYLAGVEVEGSASLPEGLTKRVLPERLVAVVTFQGFAKDLLQAWNVFHQGWLNNSGYEAIDDYDYEVYDERFHGIDNVESVMEIHFPIRIKDKSHLLTDKKVHDSKLGFDLQDLRGVKVHMANFRGAEFHGVDLRDVSFEHTNFVNSKWEHIYFSNVHVNMAQWGGTVFENIKRPDAVGSDFTEEPGTAGWVNLEPVTFLNSDLSTALFDNCKLNGVELRNCRMDGMTINGIPVQDLLDSYERVRRKDKD
jgi:predicted transcriptional regulator YdeE